jgi:2-polyprenyl-3-methyl-5-hydroxy-6-metoxy-1,4-benzoquinol methylase
MSTARRPAIDDQKRFWDWHWQHWQERRTVNAWKDKRHATILAFLRSLRLDQPMILDLGCGPGWYTEKLAQFGPTTGVDLSEEAISMAKSRFPHITFVAANLYELQLPAARFDVVVSQEVFDHVEDQRAFVGRVATLLKSRGYLILSCTNKFVMDRLREGEFPPQPAAHIAQYLNARELKRLLRTHFRVIRITSVLPMGSRGILRLINSYKLNTLLRYLLPPTQLDALKERGGFGYQLIVLAQKRT